MVKNLENKTEKMQESINKDLEELKNKKQHDFMNSMKRQKDRTLKDELPRVVDAQYAAGDQWRKNSRKNREMEPKQKQHPVVDVTGDGSKVRCCKKQYCIGT